MIEGARTGPVPVSPYFPPDGPLRVVHLDDHLIAIDKPPGLLSVPGRTLNLAECLLSRVQAMWPGTLLVHRLDRDTSGVMIFARTSLAQRHLGLQFERRHLQKSYIALVHGQLPQQEGVIDLPLAADWPNRPRQKVDFQSGRSARTRWRALFQEPGGISRVALFPETGRSHQLRIHMVEMGCPIVGDPLYGRHAGGEARRMMLHASALTVRHPIGGEKLHLTAEPGF